MSEENSVIGSKLSLALSITTLAIPILYLIGYGYYQGYMGAFGVSVDFFPQSVQNYLVAAFFAFSYAIVATLNIVAEQFWIYLILAAFMAGFGALMVWISSDAQQLAIRKHRERIRSNPLSLYFFVPIGLGIFSLVTPYFLVVALSIFVAVPYIAHKIGDDEAKASIEAFRGCPVNERPNNKNCVYIYHEEKLVAKGLLIARSDEHIALFEDDKAVILPSTNYRIVVLTPD